MNIYRLAKALGRFFHILACQHPAHRLAVAEEPTSENIDEDFDKVTFHLVCRKCTARVNVSCAYPIGGVDAFMSRYRP